MTDQTKQPKQPVIRKGQRKPYAKATRQQIELRIETAAVLRDLGFSKREIHSVFRQRYGVEWRQADRYMTRARAEKACSPLRFHHIFTPSRLLRSLAGQ